MAELSDNPSVCRECHTIGAGLDDVLIRAPAAECGANDLFGQAIRASTNVRSDVFDRAVINARFGVADRT